MGADVSLRSGHRLAGVEAICFPTVPLPAPPIRAGGDSRDDMIEVGGRQVPEGMTLPRNTLPVCALARPA